MLERWKERDGRKEAGQREGMDIFRVFRVGGASKSRVGGHNGGPRQSGGPHFLNPEGVLSPPQAPIFLGGPPTAPPLFTKI